MLEMKNVSKAFPEKPPKQVLNDVSFGLEPYRTTALMGQSGSGKTTLARILLALEAPDTGGIWWNGREVQRHSRQEMLRFRRKVQYIAQHPEGVFDPFWTLKHSVYETGKIQHLPKSQIDTRLPELLEQVKITPATLERYPYQVSGGEIQRINLCRVLLLEPEVIVLDEATSMLDMSVQAQILNLLKEMKTAHNLTYLLISHEQVVVDWMSDFVYTIEDGCLRRTK